MPARKRRVQNRIDAMMKGQKKKKQRLKKEAEDALEVSSNQNEQVELHPVLSSLIVIPSILNPPPSSPPPPSILQAPAFVEANLVVSREEASRLCVAQQAAKRKRLASSETDDEKTGEMDPEIESPQNAPLATPIVSPIPLPNAHAYLYNASKNLPKFKIPNATSQNKPHNPPNFNFIQSSSPSGHSSSLLSNNSTSSNSFARRLITTFALDKIRNVFVISSGVCDNRHGATCALTKPYAALRSLFSAKKPQIRCSYPNPLHQMISCTAESRRDALKTMNSPGSRSSYLNLRRPFRLTSGQTPYCDEAMKVLTIRLKGKTEKHARQLASIICDSFDNINLYPSDEGENIRGYLNFLIHDTRSSGISDNIHDHIEAEYGDYQEWHAFDPESEFYSSQPPVGIEAFGGIEIMFAHCIGKLQIMGMLRDANDYSKIPSRYRNIIDAI